jgi:CubicO group peptidase (beta-lactamase class C family)
MSMPLNAETIPKIIASYQSDHPTFEFDHEAEAARLDGLGDSVSRSARYVGSQGCHIMPASGDTALHFTPVEVTTVLPPAATLGWPMGDAQDGPINTGAWAAIGDAAMTDLGAQGAYTAAFLVLHKGQIVCERYGDGIGPNTQLESWSMGKSVTATLVAQLMHQGHLAVGLDDPAPIPAWHADRTDPRAAITMRNLFQMSSGLQFSGFDSPRVEQGCQLRGPPWPRDAIAFQPTYH